MSDNPFRQLIQRHLRDLPIESIRELPHIGWGGDSDAMLVNGELVFRFPRTPDVARALAVEVCLLPRLAPHLPLPIPRFEYVAHASLEVGPQLSEPPLFVGYRAIQGQPLTPHLFRQVQRDPETRELLAAQLGAFLSALHSFSLQTARACGVSSPETSVYDQVAAGHARVRTQVYPALDPAEREGLEQLYSVFLGDPRHFQHPPALCHGDLSSDHILCVPPGTSGIEGVIDFGDVVIGDPAGDFVWGFEYGADFLERVLDHYSVPLPDRAAFARVVALRYTLMSVNQILYGLETGNSAYVSEGREALRARLADPTLHL